jgi:hypothetical protein
MQPLTAELVEAHLRGRVTLGQYLLDLKERVHFCALDMDLGKDLVAELQQDPSLRRRTAACVRDLMGQVDRASRELNLHVVFERSGNKGVHAWYFLEEPVPAWAARGVLVHIREGLRPADLRVRVEVFPKQIRLSGKGFGNLIKLPLGVHRATGSRSVFLTPEGKPIADNLRYLLEIRTNPRERLLAVAERIVPSGGRGRVMRFPGASAHEGDRSTEGGPPRDAAPRGRPAPSPAGSALREVLRKCAMLRYLVRKAREFGHLEFDERKIVLCVVGHLPQGAALVHRIMSFCSDYDPQITGHFISRMPRVPLGCRTIRRKLFYLDQAACNCWFDNRGKEYATPLGHLGREAGEPEEGADPGRKLAMLEDENRRLRALLRGRRAATSGRHASNEAPWT